MNTFNQKFNLQLGTPISLKLIVAHMPSSQIISELFAELFREDLAFSIKFLAFLCHSNGWKGNKKIVRKLLEIYKKCMKYERNVLIRYLISKFAVVKIIRSTFMEYLTCDSRESWRN